jgi:hypothetical protein
VFSVDSCPVFRQTLQLPSSWWLRTGCNSCNLLQPIHSHLEDGDCTVSQNIAWLSALDVAYTQKLKFYIELQMWKTKNKSFSLYVYLWILLQAGQSSFEVEGNFNSIESALFESVVSSDKNLMVSLPLGFDKTNMILLAVHNLLATHTNSLRIHKHQLKVSTVITIYMYSLSKKMCHISEDRSSRLIIKFMCIYLLLSGL